MVAQGLPVFLALQAQLSKYRAAARNKPTRPPIVGAAAPPQLSLPFLQRLPLLPSLPPPPPSHAEHLTVTSTSCWLCGLDMY